MFWVLSIGGLFLTAMFMRTSGLIESMTFFAPSRIPFATPIGIEDIELPGPDGTVLHAWRLPVPEGRERLGVVLFCHGNAGRPPDPLSFGDRLPAEGLEVILFDYRGFGRSSDRSRISRHTLFADARAAAAEVGSMHPDEPFFLLGHSMGGVMVANLAAEQPDRYAGAALIAAFDSFPGVASDFAGLLGRLLIPRGLDAEEAVGGVGRTPLLVVHGTDDRIVGVRHAHRLQDRARSAGVNSTLRIVQNANHVDIFDPPADAQAIIASFFAGASR